MANAAEDFDDDEIEYMRRRARVDTDDASDHLDRKDFDSSLLIQRSQSDAGISGQQEYGRLFNAISIDACNRTDTCSQSHGSLVSESSRVYFDLSNFDESEEDQSRTGSRKDVRRKVRRNRSLETIHQEELLEVSRGSQFSYSCSSADLLDDIDEHAVKDFITETPEKQEHASFYTKYPLLVNQSPVAGSLDNHATWQNKNNLKLKYQQYCCSLEKNISQLKRATGIDEVLPLQSILKSMTDAWNFPVYGRDLSYGLCDIIRNESVLSLLIKNCASDIKEVQVASTALLEQVMSLKNREKITKEGLETVVRMTQKTIGDHDMASSSVGILENLFKVNELTSTKVIEFGGLDSILYWCRSSNQNVLRKCAKAFSNLSLFGGPENQQIMIQQKVPEWLFPLAFSEDKHVKYYACLSIAVLVANKELEAAVIKSGTLDLVIPFVMNEKPNVFAKSDYAHRQGRDPIWLKRMIPLLSSRRPEAQALAAFHFAMEASIKCEQGKQNIFYEIGVVEPLKKVASSPNAVASRLAREALQLIGEEVPHKLSQQVPLWSNEDVIHWVSEVGFAMYAGKFEECKIDGDLLLQMTEDDLMESINMEPGMVRKRFLRELVNLKVTADYSSYDPTKIDPWLMSVLPELSQYTYAMLRHGMDRTLLATTTEEELKDFCGVHNGVHRRIIMQHLGEMGHTLVGPGLYHINSMLDLGWPSRQSLDLQSPAGRLSRASVVGDCSLSLSICPRPVDVFISYRRSTGSQLASLLKVHLQLRGFSVFLDIDRLRAGKFDENLLMNIKLAKHFLLVLTTSALDRCIGDHDRQDWVHKEIVTAIESSCNIIPILDNCDWPEPERLPEDMRPVCYFNGIRWIHDYQDACIDKIQSFIKGKAPIVASQPITFPDDKSSEVTYRNKPKDPIPVISIAQARD